MSQSMDPFRSSSRAAAHLRPMQQQLTTDRSLRVAAQGDLLVDVLRTDSANLLDLPFLADVFDDFMDEAVELPPATTSPFADGFTGNPRLVTTTSTSQVPMVKHETLRTNSSGESSDNTKASGSGTGAPAVTTGTHAAKQAGAGQHATFSIGGLSDGMGSKDRKKRTRNQQQMEHNRVAQQKYRERKKNETQELQNAVELLTAELAAMKALEVRASELESHNLVLQQQVMMQSQQVQQLESKVAEQEAKITTQTAQLGTQLDMLTSQQKMILDQHQKLQLQEEIIASLKDRLKESVDRAWDSIEATATDPHVVCRRMHEAVLEAMRGAKNVEGLQETLATLPDELVVEICKNIMITCKDLFPQLAEKMSKCGAGGKLPQNCAVAAQVSGPTH